MAIQTSLWPLCISFSLFSLLGASLLWLQGVFRVFQVMFRFVLVVMVSFLWWKDLARESILGYHTHKLEVRLRVSMLLFILSEVFFFVSFFWAFYDAALSPAIELGLVWPPKGIVPLRAYAVPLLNTVILLTSGVTVTWAHHRLVENYFLKTVVALAFTVSLGAYFLRLQWLEYAEAQFRISDGVFGSTFFMSTGFHGVHVIIGTCFLFYVLVALIRGKLLYFHHFSFEAAAWYWHFVDVVWLILFVSIYWWGGL